MSKAPSQCRQRHHYVDSATTFVNSSLSLIQGPPHCIKIVHKLRRTTYAPIYMRNCTQQRFGKQKQHVYTTFCVFVCHVRSGRKPVTNTVDHIFHLNIDKLVDKRLRHGTTFPDF